MLRWIRTGIRPEASLDGATLWVALLLGFFFLLRASEYFAPEVGDRAAKGVRGADLTPRLQGSPISSFALADEVVLTIRGSKTDQLNEGNVKSHFRAAGVFCVIEALQYLQAREPERWRTERHDPLLRWANGKSLRRREVQAPIMQAAGALGGDPARIGTHSLRFGGASALGGLPRPSRRQALGALGVGSVPGIPLGGQRQRHWSRKRDGRSRPDADKRIVWGCSSRWLLVPPQPCALPLSIGSPGCRCHRNCAVPIKLAQWVTLPRNTLRLGSTTLEYS